MPAYIVVDLHIHDRDAYQEYIDGFYPIFDRYGGKLLVSSAKPVETLEGGWVPKGIVILEFPDIATAKAWKADPDYVELARIRYRNATTQMILVEGN